MESFSSLLAGDSDCNSSFFDIFDEGALDEVLRILSSSEYSSELALSSKCPEHVAQWPQSAKQIDSRLTCPECGVSFQRKYDVSRHVQTVHLPDERKYACDQCDKRFKRQDGLVFHRNKVHQNATVPCGICKKRFVSDTRSFSQLLFPLLTE